MREVNEETAVDTEGRRRGERENLKNIEIKVK